MTHELEKLQRKGTVPTCPHCDATVLSTSQPDLMDDPFNRRQVEAVCRAVCVVEGVDPDDDVYGDGCDPKWSRYADAVAAALAASQPERMGTTMHERGILASYSDLPEEIQHHLLELEIFIGDCDGKETVISNGETCIDDGTLDAEDAVKAFNGIVECLRAALAATHAPREDGPCFYCGEQTCSIAGDPGRWPLVFCQPEGTGIVRFHHTGCVTDRLFTAAPSGTQGALALYLNEVQPVDGRVLINISIDELSVLRRLVAAAVGGEASEELPWYSAEKTSEFFNPTPATPAVGGERVSFRRQWLQTCYYQMANMKLPSGYVGDWLFLFREQIKDVLDKPAQPASLCSDCPPAGYPTDETRCLPCPRRFVGTSDGETKA